MKKTLSAAFAMGFALAIAVPTASACPSEDCPCSDKATVAKEEDQSKPAKKTAPKDKAQTVQKDKKAPAKVTKK